MNKLVEKILQEAASDDPKVKGEAGLKLNELFEQSVRNIFRNDPYVLPVELRTLQLSVDEQREVIQRLEAIILASELDPSSLLWAIAKAHPLAALDSILNLTHADLNLNNHAIYQILIGFDNYLAFTSVDGVNSWSVGKIRERYPTAFFEDVQNRTYAEYENTRDVLGWVVKKLNAT